jgi:uncharacterized protein
MAPIIAVAEDRMPESAASPTTVFNRLIQGIAQREWHSLSELYAADAVVDQPFGLPRPLRLEGRDQLAAHFAAAVHLPLELVAHNVVIHQTHDPEVIVAEFDYAGRLTSTGRAFSLANVIVLRVRSGQIVASRDYHNHAALAEILGHSAGMHAGETSAEKTRS